VIIVTSEDIAHKRIVKTLGLVRGNTIRARHLGHDIAAVLKSMIGGEISDYTKMMAEAREQAIDRMIAEAKDLGANAIVQVRFSTSSMLQGASEFLVYGTAVVVENDD
jgi:uncharacterized protein YbjQ (UPF0145 family)